MSSYDGRISNLLSHLRDARNELGKLDDSAWATDEGRQRLEGILAYAEIALTTADPELVSDTAVANIQAALLQIVNNPAVAAQNPDSYGSTLLDTLVALPSTRGRDIEQAVKDAAANFQRSAQHRLNALNKELDAAKAEGEALRAEVVQHQTSFETRAKEIQAQMDTDIADRTANFEARFSELHARATDEQTALSRLRTSQTSTFEEAEEQRATAAKSALDAAETALRETQRRLTEEMNERVEEIRRMESESAQLVGAIGLAGTAERYAEEVTQQKEEADKWRGRTVILALLAVAGVVYALAESHPAAETFAGKLSLSLILGGVATYAARQSSNHRHREERARDLQLELTAFSPFIEPLSPEQQEEERVIMTRKTFGKTTSARSADEEPGPTPLSFVLRRREREPAAPDA